MNIIDKAVEIVSPNLALQRQQARIKLDFINSGYSEGGASKTKTALKGFDAVSKNVIEDIDKNLMPLRQRARILDMTAPIARSARNNVRTNVVGQGLKLKSRIDFNYLGLTQNEADEWEKNVEREFNLWAEDTMCDSKDIDNFYELQQIALLNWVINGDAFAIIKRTDNNKMIDPYNLKIQLIEADRICTPGSNGTNNLVKKLDNGNKILNGVEVNSDGTVIGYHVCSSYPNVNEKKTWTFVRKRGEKTNNVNIIHVMEGERAEQYRGVPFLAPVIETLKQITRYTDAELMAAVINGMFSVFVEVEKGEDVGGYNGFDEEEEKSTNEMKLGNGTINFLDEGQKISTVDPTRPNVNFTTFVTGMCKQIGGALEIPHELLLKDFNSSYSASRAALLEAWKAFRMRRTWFANDFCQPIFEVWLSTAIALGRIKAPGYFNDPLAKKSWSRCEWNGPAQGQIDPVKEVRAASERVQSGFSTREAETMQLTGGDFDRNVEQLLLESEKMRKIEGGANVVLGNK